MIILFNAVDFVYCFLRNIVATGSKAISNQLY